jgi:glycine betaine/proline transport system substrate-binding protein
MIKKQPLTTWARTSCSLLCLILLSACQQSTPSKTTTSQSDSGQSIQAQSPDLVRKPEEGKTIRPAASTNYYSQFLAEIVNQGLRELGYTVEETQQMQITLGHVAVKNGDAHFLTAHWENLNYAMFLENGGGEAVERVGVLVNNAVQGYLIDKKTADEYQLTNLEQLQDPEIAKLFDSDGDGLADLIGCNPGWSCGAVTEHHLQAYDLVDTVEFVQGEYDALVANTITRLEQGETILSYAYSPHWASAVLQPDVNVIWMEVPFTSLPDTDTETEQIETSIDGKNLGFAVDRIRVVANSLYLAENPVAKRWLELVSVPIEDVNAQQKLVYDGENKPEDILRHAQEWVEVNRNPFDRWLAEARQVSFSNSESAP